MILNPAEKFVNLKKNIFVVNFKFSIYAAKHAQQLTGQCECQCDDNNDNHDKQLSQTLSLHLII